MVWCCQNTQHNQPFSCVKNAKTRLVVKGYVARCSSVSTSKGGCARLEDEIYSFTRTNISPGRFSRWELVSSSGCKWSGKSDRVCILESPETVTIQTVLLYVISYKHRNPHSHIASWPFLLRKKKKWFAVLSTSRPPSWTCMYHKWCPILLVH